MTPTDASILHQSSFPASDLPRALRELAREVGLVSSLADENESSLSADDGPDPLANAGARLGVEIVAVKSTCGELEDMLRRLGPSLLRLAGPEGGEARYLAVIGGGSFGLKVLTPERGVRRLSRKLVQDGLIHDLLGAELVSVGRLVDELRLNQPIGERGLRAFALERLDDKPVTGIWLLRPSPGSAAGVQTRATHLPFLLSLLVVTRASSTALLLSLWWLIGRDVFGSSGFQPSIGLWALCAFGMVPLRLLDVWTQSRLALDAGTLFKDALLYGVLNLDRTAVRGRGVGQFLGTVMEGEISSTAMESGVSVFVAFVEVVAALFVLAAGAEGNTLVLLLLGWIAFTVWSCRRYARQAQRWIDGFRLITHDLVERMVGYQTRVVQERVEDRHREEDALLHDYFSRSKELDRRKLLLDGLTSYGWLLLGLSVLEPALVSGAGSASSTAISLGGILLASNALKHLVGGAVHLVDVWVAWQQTGPILEAGQRAFREGVADGSKPKPRTASADGPMLRFDGLSLRYAKNAPAALSGCSQEIRAGDRVLLEGPSGGGKSTLAAVLSGIRAQGAGSIRLLGVRSEDMSPQDWRGKIVLVPQFHENHVLTESLLFNLLLGRRWPPTAEDTADAMRVCDLLGLTPLVERMPLGLAQPVGDGGWTLSHGERSRVFLARALLQEGAHLVILDESFAALDPETLRQSIEGVLASAPAMLVIAHP